MFRVYSHSVSLARLSNNLQELLQGLKGTIGSDPFSHGIAHAVRQIRSAAAIDLHGGLGTKSDKATILCFLLLAMAFKLRAIASTEHSVLILTILCLFKFLCFIKV